jgi:hypothetical protein
MCDIIIELKDHGPSGFPGRHQTQRSRWTERFIRKHYPDTSAFTTGGKIVAEPITWVCDPKPCWTTEAKQ